MEELVKEGHGSLIVLVGKTSTGKSTFAKKIGRFGFNHIELDHTVRQSVVEKFKLGAEGKAFAVYKGTALKEWQDSFERSARKLIKEKLSSEKVVIDAAFANTEVVKRILKDLGVNYLVIYFHPFNKDFYYKSIFSRFEDDYKKKARSFPIWDFLSPEDLADFVEKGEVSQKIWLVIKKYADESIKLSVERYENFAKEFPEIMLTGH